MNVIACYNIEENLLDTVKKVFNEDRVIEVKNIENNADFDIFLAPEIPLPNNIRTILYDKNIPIVKIRTNITIDPSVLIFNNEYVEYEEIYKGKFATTLLTNNELSKRRIKEFINKRISLSFNDFPDDMTIEKCIDTLKFMSYEIELINNSDVGHCMRVAKYSEELAKTMKLSKKEIKNIYVAGLLHDIGKLKIPNAIFLNDKKCSERQIEILKNHPIFAYNMLQHPMYDEIKKMILYHHERCDGSGYYGLFEKDIPIGSKIVAIADSFDAMKSKRIYSEAMPIDIIIKELKDNCNKLYDQALVNEFVEDVI